MSLVVDLQITGRGRLEHIERMVITRCDALDNPEDPDKEEHTYTVDFRPIGGAPPTRTGIVRHVYGDGAWVLVSKALDALREGVNSHDH